MDTYRDHWNLCGTASKHSSKKQPAYERGATRQCSPKLKSPVLALTFGSNQDSNFHDQASHLRSEYDDLTSQFRGFPTSPASSNLREPNNRSLKPDFAHTGTLNQQSPSSSVLKRSSPTTPNTSKSVRFRDNPNSTEYHEERSNVSALFPYRDEPEGPPDQTGLNNQQIHEYHKNVLQDQDEQLDRLGDSIGRQRDLSIQIGNELEDHVHMLDEVEEHVDRHQSTLNRARKSLGDVARKSRDNKQLTIILVLILILVLLIIILKWRSRACWSLLVCFISGIGRSRCGLYDDGSRDVSVIIYCFNQDIEESMLGLTRNVKLVRGTRRIPLSREFATVSTIEIVPWSLATGIHSNGPEVYSLPRRETSHNLPSLLSMLVVIF